MKVLLWEMNGLSAIVLWDGEYIYWSDELLPSGGYKKLQLGKVCSVTQSRFMLVGEL